MRRKYARTLTGSGDNNSVCIEVTKRYDALTKEYVEIIRDKVDRVIKFKNPASINNVFKCLLNMSVSFSQINSCYYKDENICTIIMDSLERLQTVYNTEAEACGNWWYWEIGIPISVNGIFTLMYDYADRRMIDAYMMAERHFNDEIKLTGCNRVWESVIFAIRGVLLENEAMIKAAVCGIADVMVITESGDGFYEDGSFIQHENIPYNGGYGRSLLQELAPLLYMLKGSEYEIKDTQVIEKWIKNSYLPFIVNGRCMDMVRGREVSRYYEQCDFSGARMISAILIFCEVSENCEDILRAVKSHIGKEFFKYASLFTAELAWKLMEDEKILAQECTPYFKVFNSMDRAVKHMKGCAIGLAMHSERVAAFESINEENTQAFHSADGMMYLYKDNEPKSDFFWQTIDQYRLPGTTVLKYTEIEPNKTSKGEFVGGCGIGEYGVCSMEVKPPALKLWAKKSWFFFDEEVVCMGSDIKSKENINVETIIENRLIEDNSRFTVSGTELEDGYKITGAYLDGKHDIGYYFPEGQKVKILREQRQGCWKNINVRDDGKVHHGMYITMWIDHGRNIHDGEYAYIVLPKCSEEEFKAYSDNCPVNIIENSHSIQCVSKGNVTGIVFLKDKTRAIAGVACDKKCIVMTEVNNDTLEFVITDPTHKQNKIVTELDYSAKKISYCDERIKVIQLSPQVVIETDVEKAAGKELRLKLEGIKNV